MDSRKPVAVLIALVLSGALITLYLSWGSEDNGTGTGVCGLSGTDLSEYIEEQQSKVAYMHICGNSSDIVYCELMEATFTPIEPGAWWVEVLLLDDSGGPCEVTQSTETFTASSAEVNTINSALYDGLDQTYASEDMIQNLDLQMGFALDIVYEDGTWISLLTLQSSVGHIVVMCGAGTPDRNLLGGDLLEPGSALDGLVAALNGLFVSHLG